MPTTYYRTFTSPYFTGTAASAGAPPTKYDVSLNGIGYLLDLTGPAEPYTMQTLPLLKAMFLQDRGTAPIGEHSLNPEDYWRRSVDDWVGGAGQKNADHADSVTGQFRVSKGIDCWTTGQITLLPTTTRQIASSNTNLALAVAGAYLYILNGNALTYVTDITGTPAQTVVTAAVGTLSSPTAMTSDGYTVWACDGTRVYYTLRAGATYAKFHTADHVATLIKSTKGRLFTANANVLYTHTLTAGSAVATAYFTHPNADWTWTAIEGGPDAVYFAGYSGDHSAIYAATIKADGTSLDVPVVVASMPSGELARSLKAYLSVMVIGTDKGFRAASINSSSGSLILGALVPLSSPPKCFEAQDRFIWYGYTNYDSTSTGLGRIDLSTFNGTTPAYASDLMATAQGAVLSVVTFQSLKVFAVSGSGIWLESTNKVTSGTLSNGWLNYNLADSKIAIKLAIQHRAGAGTYALALAVDDNTAVTVGTTVTTSSIAGNNETMTLPQIQGRSFEVTLTLNRSGSDTTAAPVLDRVTLMVEPQPERRAKFVVPFLLHSSMTTKTGATVYYSASDERARFYALLQSRQIVPFQDFENTYQVIVDDFHWVPYEEVGVRRTWDGTLVAELKIIS